MKTGSQTHLHLGINAAGKFWVGMEIFHAAPHLEKVERVVHKFFRRHPRCEGSVINVVSRNPLSRNASQSRRDRSAGEFVFQMQLDQRSEAQPQAIRVSLGKSGAQNLIEHESRFEIGAGQRVFDPADAISQVEALGAFFRQGKQPLQPAAQVGRLADVGLGVRILAAQKKHGGGSGYGGEDLGVSFRPELDTLAQHACDCSACDGRAESSKTCALELLPEVRTVHLHDAAHLLQPGTHALADAVAEGFFARGRPRGR